MRYLIFTPLCFIAMLVPVIGYSNADDGNLGIPNTIWETTIRDPNLEYELKASGIARNGSLICLILGSRPKGGSTGPQDLELRIVDTAGKLTTSIELNSYLQPTDSQKSEVRIGGCSVSDAGIVFLASAQTKGQVLVVGVDIATRQSVVNSMLNFGYKDIYIHKLLLTKTGGLLLVGSANENGFIAEISRTGKILWKKTIDGQVDVLFSAIEVDNGFVVVGGKGGSNAYMWKEIWAGIVGSKGELIRNVVFSGPSRAANIAQGSQGQYVIIFDRLDGAPQSEMAQVVVQGISRDLLPKWKRTLVTSTPITSPFHIEAIDAAGYVVAGVKEKGRLWVSRVKEEGTVVWEHSTKAAPPNYLRFHDADILRSDKDFVLLSRLSTVSDRMQQQIVKVTKFAIK